MKLLIHTATGKTALIAFLIHLAISGWCFTGSVAAGGQHFLRTMEPNNWPSNPTNNPAPLSATGGTIGNSATIRKRSIYADYPGRLPLSTMTMMRVQESALYAVQSAVPATASALVSDSLMKRVSLGLLLPHTTFRVREYSKAVQTAMNSLRKQDLSFINTYRFQVSDIHTDMLKVNPSPTAILDMVCETFLKRNVSAILFLSNTELYGRNTAAAQYFLQLTNYLRIPVIAWNADNSGLEKRSAGNNLVIQLAPSAFHQANAMLSLLKRYSWKQFSIVTSTVAGYREFIQAVAEAAYKFESHNSYKFKILGTVLVNNNASNLGSLLGTEARILLLYSTREEARSILKTAGQMGLAGDKYVWIVTQSVIGSTTESPPEFPVGMLGVHFETTDNQLTKSISTALKVFVNGVEAFHRESNSSSLLSPKVSCEDSASTSSRWAQGEQLFKYLQNVRIDVDPGRPPLEFDADGTRSSVELTIVNLQPSNSGGSGRELLWRQIGHWHSWKKDGLDIQDIVWPGHSHVPPEDGPDKFHLKVAFLEEPPFISIVPPDPVSGRCPVSHGVPCHVGNHVPLNGESDLGHSPRNVTQCCSGFCVDLLEKFSDDLGFTYELIRVDDPKFGTHVNGRWNGLMGALANRRVDMVMTSLTVNAEREHVADFTIPFMETGIAILVAKRTGIISPTAFLEPFDTASWLLVGVVAIQVAALAIFLFEWLSPSGYNMQLSAPTNQRFSLFRTYWLVWAILFQASVNIDCPRGFTSRFISNVWATFAVVFLAIYTANLAAFMITREEFYDLSGVEDPRLISPKSHEPPFRFGTVFNTHTEATILKHYKEMHYHMRNYNLNEISAGIDSVKRGELDAFLYDGAVLDYLVSQDEECRLLTVGSWYAMTGYGVAFPRGSKYVAAFNEKLLEYIENGDVDRLRRFWLTGVCKPYKEERQFSEPLSTEQFLSAFLLLLSGIGLAFLLLALEHIYFHSIRPHLTSPTTGACCSLISINMGKSLTFRDAVFETQDRLRSHRCRDAICRLHLRRLNLQLDCVRSRVRQLEKQLGESNQFIGTAVNDESQSVEVEKNLIECQATTRQLLEGIPEMETVL
ncbi:LOW QUALITY PROTEIN: glutamate receptor ionotropic, NMDA 2B-like [Daphnia carinata]|uniref:LOW QUALITY PROTEIN: glutamate receptor ionotropic, NMDA 2B-like n=1 Tax=Daphnia carinata TaxID=120202 RepID=UPI00257F7BAD|nr:LOW QUALITY PROTEIN: glutamate receptor ionotropic, NMDA 2B-like [Daphnia carinata]